MATATTHGADRDPRHVRAVPASGDACARFGGFERAPRRAGRLHGSEDSPAGPAAGRWGGRRPRWGHFRRRRRPRRTIRSATYPGLMSPRRSADPAADGSHRRRRAARCRRRTMARIPFPRDRVSRWSAGCPTYLRLTWRLAQGPDAQPRPPRRRRSRRGRLRRSAPSTSCPGVIPVLGQLDDIAVALARPPARPRRPPSRPPAGAPRGVGLADAHLADDLRTVGATTAWIARSGIRVSRRACCARARHLGEEGRGSRARRREGRRGSAGAGRRGPARRARPRSLPRRRRQRRAPDSAGELLPVDPRVPSHQRCQVRPSVPAAKTSSRSAPQELAAGVGAERERPRPATPTRATPSRPSSGPTAHRRRRPRRPPSGRPPTPSPRAPRRACRRATRVRASRRRTPDAREPDPRRPRTGRCDRVPRNCGDVVHAVSTLGWWSDVTPSDGRGASRPRTPPRRSRSTASLSRRSTPAARRRGHAGRARACARRAVRGISRQRSAGGLRLARLLVGDVEGDHAHPLPHAVISSHRSTRPAHRLVLVESIAALDACDAGNGAEERQRRPGPRTGSSISGAPLDPIRCNRIK